MTLFASVETLLAVGTQMVCSVGMMIFNQMAVQAFPVECTLVSMQMAFTTVVMLTCCWGSLRIGSMLDVLRWLMVVPFFVGTLLTNILALKYTSMTLIIVFRVLSPLLSLAVERFYPEPVRLSTYGVGSILVMFAGAATFTYNMPTSEFKGLHWVLLNIVFAVGDRVLQRLMLATQQDPVDLSMTAATLLNNLVGQFPVLLVMCIQQEIWEIPGAFRDLKVAGWTWVALSCLVGVGSSYASIWAQSRISATSFLVLMNANKFTVIFIEAFCLGTRRLTHLQLMGACVAVAGGIAYSSARKACGSASPRGLAARGGPGSQAENQPLLSSTKQPAAV